MIPNTMDARLPVRNVSVIRLVGGILLVFCGCLLPFSLLNATNESSLNRIARLSQEAPRTPATVDALIDLAADYGRAKLDSSILALEEALRLADRLGDDEGELETLRQLTISTKNARRFDEAISYGLQGLRLSKKLGRPEIETALLNTMGTAFSRSQRPDSAVMYYYESLEKSLQRDDKEMVAKVYNNLGIFFTSAAHQSLPDAKKNFLKSYEIIQEGQDLNAQLRGLLNLGAVYGQLEEFDSAYYFLELGAEISRETKRERYLAQFLTNIAASKQVQERNDEALSLLKEVLVLKSVRNDPSYLVSIMVDIGVSLSEQKNYVESLSYYRRALEEVRLHQLKDYHIGMYGDMANIFEGMGRLDSAVLYLRRRDKAKEDYFNESKARAIEDANVKYETLVQEKKLLLTENERIAREQERNSAIAVSGLLGLFLILGYLAYQSKQRTNKRLSIKNEIIAKKESEKTLLLRELHHRVKNNLQLISSLLNLQAYRLQDKEAASAVKEGQARVEAMAMIHRQLYLKEEETKISLPDYLENMMQNLLYAFGAQNGKVKVEQEVEDLAIDADLAIPLGLIINELLTNSFKYAFRDTPKPVLTITAKVLPSGLLSVLVADNGPGISSDTDRKQSFGMEMVKSLAKQMKAHLEINHDEGFTVSLDIPFHTSVAPPTSPYHA